MPHTASHNHILRRSLRGLLTPTSTLAMLGLPGTALAGPIGEDVIRGEADIVRPDANNTVINQYTDRAVINWQTFNVDADEYVLFNQPDASSIVLNRVIGGDTSHILGHIESNGQVFLLNPFGVFFTHGASLDVQGFLGSTLDMDPDSFMAGDFTLTRSASAPSTARVVNDGEITAGPGGYVLLAGDFAENTGVITANAGTVALVSGNALTLDIEGDGLVSFTVDEATLSEAAGVRNAGSLIANGGRVMMTAKVANDLVATAVNNEGLVRAHSVEERNGEIWLVGNGGDVVNSGTLDADGENANGGGIGIVSDRNVTLADGGVQTAAGDGNHKGGVIRAIAEEHLDYQRDNLIRVTGGTSGGFVEVSGHGSLALRGIPQIGVGGTFLIDPQSIRIGSGSSSPNFGSSTSSWTQVGAGYIEQQLGAGANVLLIATDNIRYTGTSPATINVTGNNADLTVAIGMVDSAGGASDPGSGEFWAGNIFLGGTPTYIDYTNGSIDLASLDINIGGDITLDANQGTIKFDRLTTSNGNVIIDAGDGYGSIVGGAGGIDAAGSVTIGTLPSNPSYGGDVMLNGAVDAGSDIAIAGNRVTTSSLRGNNINLEIGGSNARLSVAGNVDADGNASFTNNDINTASSADIAVAGNITADGAVTIDGTRITVNGVNASSVDVSIKGSNASFVANGAIIANNNVKVGQFGQGIANIAVNNVQASRIWMYADGFIETGNLNALGSLATPSYSERGVIHLYAMNGVETGHLNAINDLGGARIDLMTDSGNITIHGDVSANGAETIAFGTTRLDMYASNGGIHIEGDLEATGYGGMGDGFPTPGVAVDLSAYGSAGITIDGAVTVTGHPGSFSDGDSSGVIGDAIFYAWANGLGNLDIGGPVEVTGTGHAEADLYGRNVTTGNISVVANPASHTRTGLGLGENGAETASAVGTAEIVIDTGVALGVGTINVGDLSATGPNAEIHLVDATTFTTGAITVNATGSDVSFASSYGGDVFQETSQGGDATLFVGRDNGSASSMAIDINGGINVTAVGRGSVELRGNHVATRSISVTAEGGEYSREGTMPFSGGEIGQCDGPCSFSNSDWPYDGDFGGPRIDTGTVSGGAATIRIAGMQSSGGFTLFSGSFNGDTPADSVQIDGSLVVKAPGTASVDISGNDISVSGGIAATATRAQLNGNYQYSGSTSGGVPSFTSGTVVSSVGRANVELRGADSAGHAVSVVGGIAVSGPRANFNAEGGDITLGNLSVTASGFAIDVDEATEDNSGAPLGEFSFAGSHMVTGVGVEGAGDVRVGNVNIEGPGAAGILFEGATITTGSINVRATAGEFTTTTPSFNGGTTTTQQTGAAVVGFESPAVATVNGDLTIEGARTAHVGGRANVSGDFTITGGNAVLVAPPAYVDFLDNIDDGDVGEDPLTLPVAAIRATNIAAQVTSGNLVLGAAQLRATNAMTLAASGSMDLSGQTFNMNGDFEAIAGAGLNASGTTVTGDTIRLEAGTNLLVSNVDLTADAVALVAGNNITNSNPPGTITAGALAILAGGVVDLSNTTLVIGNGSIASVPGDTRFVGLLEAEGIEGPGAGPNLVISGRNVSLGGGSLGGDYVYVQANGLAVNGSFSTSNPNLLLQIAPLGAGATFSLERNGTGGGNASYSYEGGLAAFNAGTIALGSTDHTGNVGIGQGGVIDIGDTNLFVLTGGTVRGLDNVVSTGVVKDLATLLRGGFDVPQTDEIDTSQDIVQSLRNDYELEDRGEDEEEGDEEGEDTDTDTDVEEDNDSLIRQDTVDEEMMCQ